MEILEAYLLGLLIVISWQFCLVRAIKYIFKVFMAINLRVRCDESSNPDERKRLDDIYASALRIISHINYREFLELLQISKDIEQPLKVINKGKQNHDSPLTLQYANETFQCMAVCLYLCTVKGFIRGIFHMIKKVFTGIFTIKFSHLASKLAQPVALMFLLVSSIQPMGITYTKLRPETVFSDSDSYFFNKV